jgi:hypothetical protein
VRPFPIPHLHDWKKMEVFLINFNKGKDDEGCLKVCNILKWSATVYGKLLKVYLRSTVRCDSISESPTTVLKTLYTLAGGPLNFEDLGFSLSSL